jgi:mRNA interferase RelE/StbE
MLTITIRKQATKFLSRLDAKSYKIISNAIKNLTEFRNKKNLDVKLLKGVYKNMYRLRVGSRRILFTVNEDTKIIKIWIIEDRGDVY